MVKKYTVEQFRKYLLSQKSIEHAFYYLSEENIEKALRDERNRNYDRLIENDDDVYTIKEWQAAIKNGFFGNYDGVGYWAKNGQYCHDEVFSSEPQDATHVIWFNK
jgi:hypothetical protein